ncbi:Long-chain fatty acid transport protein [Meinhardsimonia xiamenensis]|jgi:long-subunit fatty acid transport protein|uniref:Long-chain fatty acid transport protein n=1 Tax=Meinhardsimonia xiamenensis TaxID=990712 RepID=A0A1G9G0U9_9RHOB|nr:outer membrane protein transport protein [Meinhardsimonia xiamenensis]PRX32726.1 long-subunit fatty acid transport protein [Meinhardsimonia xiamenensis]SDK94270.1 Long-chain fatty acid transport protein [Meinhardsimonia xiamenensis]
MLRFSLAASCAALVAGSAIAGGLDRSGQPVSPLFEAGSYGEFTLSFVAPSVSGVATAASPTPGASSGDMAADYFAYSFAFKTDISDRLSVALLHDQPWGADTDYPAGTGYFAQGSTATLNSDALTALVRYRLGERFSVHGGVRIETISATATIPFVTAVPGVTPPYQVTAATSSGTGWVAGAAYEIPQYALRVAVTYNSSISHNLATSESSVLGPSTSTTPVTFPQSLNLDFQTGLNPKTLLFGGVRWVEWSSFEMRPADYATLTGDALVSYDSDTITYTLGLGRKLTETLSAAVTLGYEAPTGGFSSNLGPKDGMTSLGLGLSHQRGKVKISGGVRYVMVGDAQTTLDDVNAASDFTGNSALAVGMKVGFNF